MVLLPAGHYFFNRVRSDGSTLITRSVLLDILVVRAKAN